MKIGVVIEGSTKTRSEDVANALKAQGHEVIRMGMLNVEGEPDLTYMETAFMTALSLELGIVEFIVGGCGTGQGYMNAVLQYPGTACGMILDPVDAFLWSQVNAGNCISLALNKGYSLGSDINLSYIFEKLFGAPFGEGYPPARKEIQIAARKKLSDFSRKAHQPMEKIVAEMDGEIFKRAMSYPGFLDLVRGAADGPLKKAALDRFASM